MPQGGGAMIDSQKPSILLGFCAIYCQAARMTWHIRLGRVVNRMVRRLVITGNLLLVLVILVGCASPSDLLFSWTGETEILQQAKALLQASYDLARPRRQTADYTPVAHAGFSPFGVNTFLEQEVEPAKREQSARMIADAGFDWIRQEFPWEDIEIHGKGDFEDRRHEPHRSAWDKYDQIVDLAEQYDLALIVRLGNPPAWSRAAGDDMGAFAPPDDYADFGDFVEAVVSRYRGRIRYYQIWNEPNIYPEWGERAVDPASYVELLRVGYTRAKAADPDVVVICGALASTIELDYRNLNDFAFLQQMYDAGAGAYFDVLAMQGYGLWSGPTDRRLHPRVINFSRPLYVRDIMVRNGDAAKSIWISEMNWNAAPDESVDKPYGQVTPEEQARYAVMAYERIQREWPWLGVANLWFFKRATDLEASQPMYYFRMVEPDFTPLPLYGALAAKANEPPVIYCGYHQEDHWALEYAGDWSGELDADAALGAYRATEDAGASVQFTFEGRQLQIVAPRGPAFGLMQIQVDQQPLSVIDLRASGEEPAAVVWTWQSMAAGPHTASIEPINGRAALDGLVVRPWPEWTRWWPAGLGALLLLAAAGAMLVTRRQGVRLRSK
jgi:polysaccharide biosynthesis protein PslG